jgi:hypothetical protein
MKEMEKNLEDEKNRQNNKEKNRILFQRMQLNTLKNTKKR